MPGSMSLSDRQPPPGHRQHAAAVSAAAGETMMMSGSGSVLLPAGIINPSVPIRNIKMKFAVVIGLIQVGEVNNRDIVETVLNLVSKRFFPSCHTVTGRYCLILNLGCYSVATVTEYNVDIWQNNALLTLRLYT